MLYVYVLKKGKNMQIYGNVQVFVWFLKPTTNGSYFIKFPISFYSSTDITII